MKSYFKNRNLPEILGTTSLVDVFYAKEPLHVKQSSSMSNIKL